MRRRKKNKFYYVLFLLVFLGVSTGYAALNSALMINGTSNIRDNTWDVHFENIQVLTGAVTANAPTIDNTNTSITFSAALELPGDYYGFTVDIVNAGTLDAMVDSIVKTPELTTEQKKYLDYVIEYQNGDSVATNEVILRNTCARLKVRIEYRSDVALSEMPATDSSLSLSFKINFVQNNNDDNSIVENYGKALRVVSGDGTQAGNEICIRDECFYVMSSNSTSITMLSKYNLHIGYKFDDTNQQVLLANPTSLQHKTALGWVYNYSVDNPIIGTVPFSYDTYWNATTSTYPVYVYNDSSVIYDYVQEYRSYLERLGLTINDARLITIDELAALGCNITDEHCLAASNWVYSTSFWTGTAYGSNNIWGVRADGFFSDCYFYAFILGVRPVIVIPIDMI